jgi:hypothetical chaperone protein
MTNKPTIFALDFGTTNSLLAAAAKGRTFEPVPLDPTATEPTILRSAMHFTAADDVAFGSEAIRRFVDSGLRGRLLRSIKRHLSSESFEATRIDGRRMSIEELTGAFLRVMRERACRYFDVDVDRAVIGRPAQFSNRAEQDALAEERLREAARLAGFREIWFCFEPVAAAFDFADGFADTQTVLIGDFGGGTSDFTVARMKATGFSAEDVLAVGGVSLAGDALDGALVRDVVAPLLGSKAPYRLPTGSNVLTMPGELLRILCSPAQLTLANERQVQQKIDIVRRGLLDRGDASLLDRFSTLIADAVGYQFYEAVESTKVKLSRVEQVQLQFPYPGIELDHPTKRQQFESAIAGVLGQLYAGLEQTLENAGVAPKQIQVVCLTGGTSLVPILETALRARLTSAKFVRLRSHHSVVQGLACCARALEEGTAAPGIVAARATTGCAPDPRTRSRFHRLI